MHIIAYYRVSTRRQGQSGLGLEAQREAVATYAKQHKATILHSYTEIESGSRNDRPQLRVAVSHAQATRSRLVVAKLDRLARSVLFTSTLLESNIDFTACDLPEANRSWIQMMSVFAEHERRCISERTKLALAQAKKRGVKLGNPKTPEQLNYKLGCKRGSAKAKENRIKERAAWLPHVANIIEPLRDSHTLAEIAQHLNEARCVTVNGKPFAPMTVKRILQLLPLVAVSFVH